MYRNARYPDVTGSNKRKGGDAYTAAKFELYIDLRGESRWRLIAFDGQMIANSNKGCNSKDSAENCMESVKRDIATASI